VWADIEVMREAQRKRAEEAREATAANPLPLPPARENHNPATTVGGSKLTKPDMQHAQASVQAASQRASAYLSSWGSWAAEKRKGWGAKTEVGGGEDRPHITTVTELGSEDTRNGTTSLDGWGGGNVKSGFQESWREKS
jgi:hypothetical protein